MSKFRNFIIKILRLSDYIAKGENGRMDLAEKIEFELNNGESPTYIWVNEKPPKGMRHNSTFDYFIKEESYYRKWKNTSIGMHSKTKSVSMALYKPSGNSLLLVTYQRCTCMRCCNQSFTIEQDIKRMLE